ncbi:hypothetical protein AJ79_04312 [Helicocarpus griseus UAMH5409]|uniref:Uncharacterized protein n=1 Tax=Helicocarpus griseus UAMH5409 TaxID=1447875 RepID=A0A2B7XKU9_9EURO|nr:hypothetical protein AJ79_04312 [Helicocarpus griseus UAMH5409]
MAEIRYLTPDGQPPNGGLPPHMAFQQPQAQFAAPIIPMPLIAPTPPTPPAPQEPLLPIPHGAMIPDNTNLPLTLNGGQGYIFSPKHTTIHLFHCTTHYPWNAQNGIIDFMIFHAPTNMTVEDLIKQICPRDQGIRGRGVIECLLGVQGNMTAFNRGEEYFIGEGRGQAQEMKNKVKKTLAEVGWNEHRKTGANPVWLARSISLA